MKLYELVRNNTTTDTRKRLTMVFGGAAATVLAGVNTANFIIGSSIKETDSAMLEKLILLSKQNAIVGPLGSGKIIADSPMVKCFTDTISSKENGCPPG